MPSRQLIGPSSYTGWRSSDLGRITETLEDQLLFELLGDVANRHVLDVGCGDGAFASELQKRQAEVLGVDPDWEMIGAAKWRLQTNGATVPLILAEGEHLPFAENSFDIVMAKTVLCFVEDASGMINEMARVLRPDGLFVIGELGKWSTWAAQRRLRGWMGSRLWRRGRFRTPGELRTLAAGAGLSVQQLRGAIYYPRLIRTARLMAPWDEWLGKRTTLGAAFLAMSAIKT